MDRFEIILMEKYPHLNGRISTISFFLNKSSTKLKNRRFLYG